MKLCRLTLGGMLLRWKWSPKWEKRMEFWNRRHKVDRGDWRRLGLLITNIQFLHSCDNYFLRPKNCTAAWKTPLFWLGIGAWEEEDTEIVYLWWASQAYIVCNRISFMWDNYTGCKNPYSAGKSNFTKQTLNCKPDIINQTMQQIGSSILFVTFFL